MEFQDNVEIEKAALVNHATDEEYQQITRPEDSVRFNVVFPDRLESYISKDLYVEAKTADGWIKQWVWEPAHGAMQNIEMLSDGRASFEVHNTGTASLLIRFVGIYRDVPNPTVDIQSDSFDIDSFEQGPSVVGSGRRQESNSQREYLVVGPDETTQLETTYRPFVFSSDKSETACDGSEHTGEIGLVQSPGGTVSYTFTYSLSGDPVRVDSDDGSSREVTETCSSFNSSR
ncbi:hypothetical protein [Natrinema amylolyticum]|uniref:hypothetical protein n=1 Tax=Natrinema amylolyticum TaxID=2878679 RepID=UPI001CFBBE9E|nr:hypothetical protein [Natrinema amylolyticum]